MERIQLYVPGINTVPGASRNWSGRAVTFTHVASPYRAEKVEYLCGPIDRAFGQKDRADKLYRTLSYYTGFPERVVVGHSNGADVVLTMLRNYPTCLPLAALHLVCGATEADFNRNGLNRLLTLGRIQRVYVYIAGQDQALRLAAWWPARLLGYGVLGLHGPKNVLPSVQPRVQVVGDGLWSCYGHSDCWADSEFGRTMQNFLG